MKHAGIVFGSLDASLALAQTQAVLDQIKAASPRLNCQSVVRDLPPVDPLTSEESFLAFRRSDVDSLAEMILQEKCRAVVAQAYDLPVPLPEGIEIACVLNRSTPFDALLNRQGLITDELEAGSQVGVLCLRSKIQLQCHWPDLNFQILTGGVDRAMEIHLRKSEIDGLILPAAVTEYLGIQSIVSEIFSPDFILPAPGQGALIVIGRSQDSELAELLAPLHSEPSAREIAAELAFRSHMVTDMDLPIGVLARIEGTELSIVGTTGCGTRRISVHGTVAEAEEAGSGLAQQLLCSPESFADLLEADFPQGLPPETDEDFEDGDLLDDDDFEDDISPEFD